MAVEFYWYWRIVGTFLLPLAVRCTPSCELRSDTLLAFQRSQKELEITGVADEETWVGLAAECGPRPEVTSYIVRPGDTLFIISTRFNVSIQSILEISPEITNPNAIIAGQVIRIPAN